MRGGVFAAAMMTGSNAPIREDARFALLEHRDCALRILRASPEILAGEMERAVALGNLSYTDLGTVKRTVRTTALGKAGWYERALNRQHCPERASSVGPACSEIVCAPTPGISTGFPLSSCVGTGSKPIVRRPLGVVVGARQEA